MICNQEHTLFSAGSANPGVGHVTNTQHFAAAMIWLTFDKVLQLQNLAATAPYPFECAYVV